MFWCKTLRCNRWRIYREARGDIEARYRSFCLIFFFFITLNDLWNCFIYLWWHYNNTVSKYRYYYTFIIINVKVVSINTIDTRDSCTVNKDNSIEYVSYRKITSYWQYTQGLSGYKLTSIISDCYLSIWLLFLGKSF